MKVDGKITWSYYLVFIPLWILDAIVIGFVTLQGFGATTEEDDEDPQDESEDGDTTPMAQEERKAEKRRQRKRQRNLATTFILVIVLLITAFQVLIAKRADDSTSISGPEVFIPYFALEAIFFIISLIQILMEFRLGKYAETPALGKVVAVLESLWWKIIRLTLAILIMLRIDDKITCSWALVFIPLYMVGIKYLVQLISGYRRFSRMQNLEMKQQGQTLMIVGGVVFLIVGSLAYALIGLLAARLDGQDYSVARVLIPLFIVLSILLCCSGCCLPCLLLASGAPDEDDQEGAEVRVVSPNLRIEEGGSNSNVARSSTSSRRPSRRSNNASNVS